MDDALHALLDGLAALQDPAEVERFVAACQAAEVAQAWIEHGSMEHHLRPYWQQTLGRVPRRRLPGPAGDATQLGLDASGDTVRVGSSEFLRREHGMVQRIRVRDGVAREIELAVLDGEGRVRDVLDWTSRTDPGVPPSWKAHRVLHDDSGRPRLVVSFWQSGHVEADQFVHGADGELERVEGLKWWDEPFTDDREQAVAAAIAALERPSRRSVVWDAALQRRETETPDPQRAFDGLGAALADALTRALEAVRGDLGTLAFLDVAVSPAWSLDDPVLLRVGAAGVTHRDRARDRVDAPIEVVDLTYHGAAGTALVDVLGACPPGVLKRVRAGLQAVARSSEHSATAGARLAQELAEALATREWGDVDPAFLALVSGPLDHEVHQRMREQHDVEDWGDDDEGWEEDDAWGHGVRPFPTARAIYGDARVDAFLATLLPAAKQRRPHRNLVISDRPALAALLCEQGLQADQASRVAADAAWGILLEAGEGSSRIGGRPVLPAGTGWPRASGRPLTHLVTIALGELPDVQGRDVLPADGHLAFFADLSEEGLVDVIEPEDPRELVAIIHTPEDTPAHEPEPPHDEDGGCRVRLVARLQLRRWVGVLGIDALGQSVVDRLADAVNSDGGDQLLGFPATVQDDPRAEGDVNLLHVASVDFADGGALQFFGKPEDVRACHWDMITVWGSSC